MLNALLTSILDSSRAAGNILALPPGVNGVATIRKALADHYGAEVHPDLMMIVDTPKVEDIRNLIGFLRSTPVGDMKTLWIANADQMNTQAANAFLKSLEEPTEHTRILLSTDAPARLLPTIISRCALHSVITDKQLMASELEAGGVEKKQMADAMKLAGGHVTAAIQLATVKGAMTWAKSLEPWMLGKKRPDLPPTGKTGLSNPVCALVFQAALTRAIHTKKDERLLKAADAWLKQNHDINRPGLDIKTRILTWYHLLD